MCGREQRAAGPPEGSGEAPSGGRKKLWEIERGYHCSIIGTCLSLADLDKLTRKYELRIPRSAEDYEVHGYFVKLSETRSALSKQLHKHLDRRYASAVKRFRRAKSLEALLQLWDDAVAGGDIPGPYWALITHPAATLSVVRRAFGEVHMLSHLVGASNRADVRALARFDAELSELSKLNERLEERIARERARRVAGEADAEAQGKRVTTLERQVEALQRELAERDPRDLEGRCRRLHDKVERGGLRERQLKERLDELVVEHQALRCERDALLAEQEALEHDLRRALGSTVQCQEHDPDLGALCGRAILYVGGRSSMVRHYRSLVESHGARFLHHDGGREENPQRLGEVLAQADFVCCPLDCVSHNAYQLVKSSCGKASKPHAFVRSASLSTLSRALSRFASTGT